MEINANTPKNTNSQPTPNGIGNAQRPGEYLRKIRLSQKKELSEVAEALKIAPKQLEALEKDDYASLPEALFIKGYYRAYAKYLNTDAAALIQRFDEIYSSDTGLPSNHTLKDSPMQMMGRLSRNGRRSMGKWVKRAFILILIAAVIWLLWTVLSSWMNKTPANETDTANAVNAVEILPITTASESSTTDDQLYLQFSNPTSVMISDATGKTLAQGRQDSTLDLRGQAPFSIRIDDAEAVTLKLNNEAISLSSYTKANGAADFRLSP